MKRAATHLFKKQSKNRAFFQNYRTFPSIQDPRGKPRADPGQDRRAITRPQGQLECTNARGGGGQAWN